MTEITNQSSALIGIQLLSMQLLTRLSITRLSNSHVLSMLFACCQALTVSYDSDQVLPALQRDRGRDRDIEIELGGCGGLMVKRNDCRAKAMRDDQGSPPRQWERK